MIINLSDCGVDSGYLLIFGNLSWLPDFLITIFPLLNDVVFVELQVTVVVLAFM